VRNLSIVLREAGHSVAVVDTDLRQPALSRMFGQEPEAGLTDVLVGHQQLEDALVSIPVQAQGLDTLARIESRTGAATARGGNGDGPGHGAEVVSLLSSGPQPADPQTVLGSTRTREILEQLSTLHDVVLIDSPPLLHVSDAVALAPWVDAVIIVARYGVVTRDQARRVSEVLAAIPGVNPIGVVVNGVPEAEGHGFGYGYGYGYGH
jgi:Mrp family chromosome partitioning ATPase